MPEFARYLLDSRLRGNDKCWIEIENTMFKYPVTLTPDGGTVRVTFADVPEAITFGADDLRHASKFEKIQTAAAVLGKRLVLSVE